MAHSKPSSASGEPATRYRVDQGSQLLRLQELSTLADLLEKHSGPGGLFRLPPSALQACVDLARVARSEVDEIVTWLNGDEKLRRSGE